LRVSAKTNFFRRDFLDGIWRMLPEPDDEVISDDLKVAIIGKRNAGKSTLVNALAGEDRVIVSEIAGTTRDAVDVRFQFGERTVTAIDTAGLRRKKSFQNQVEWWAFDRAKRSIERADVVLLLVDATEKLSQVDEQLAMLAQKSFKPTVIVVNKWDLAEGRTNPSGKVVTLDDYEKYLRKELQGLRFAPISFMAAKEGQNVEATINLAFELHEQAATRVSTGRLNRFVRSILETRGPSNSLGTMARIFFCAQVSTNPPTIVLVVNDPGLFTPNYQRFLLNRFREELPYDEVPIRLVIRARNRRERDMNEDEIQDLSEGQITEMALADMPDDAEAYFD
ncbi:MAG: 50S ribosome-binding GTPase, partial [Phycisphaerales bacterium]|nr:50S ribosome-binding GTPase [Phycisphaerales bacterium]